MSYTVTASYGDENMVKLLLQKGVNKNVRNKYNKTTYDLAAEHNHTKLFDRLCMAARKGEAQQIHQLLESSAAINSCNQHGWTALHRASFNMYTEAVKALLEKGIDIDAKDEDGCIALHYATESGHTEAVELLVKKGADVEAMTNKGLSALQIAESLAYMGISRILAHSSGGVRGRGGQRGVAGGGLAGSKGRLM